MRMAFPLLAVTLATGAAAEPAPRASAPGTAQLAPYPLLTQRDARVPCRDTIHAVREERGLPLLQRETASPDEPLLIAAVDQRIGGCAVMVMYDNTSDVRPLPAPREGAPLLERLPGR